MRETDVFLDKASVKSRPRLRIVAATADPDLAGLAVDIKTFFVAARSGAKAEEDGRAAWRDNTLKLAKALLTGRELHQNDNNAFGLWLDANGLGEDFINKNARAALIRIAEYPAIAERVLETTESRSWELIGNEVKRGAPSARNTPSEAKANRGDNPRKAPGQSADPIDDVARELIAKCSGVKSEWRSLAGMASIVSRPEPSVREALQRLGAKTRKDAAGSPREYRIDGERAELLARAGLVESAHDESHWRDLVAARDAEIIDLKEQVAAANATIAHLEAKLLSAWSHAPVLQ
jgi:hypothetical protein